MFGAYLPQLVLFGLVAPAVALSNVERCAQLAKTHVKNVDSIETVYLRANESYRVPASCGMGLGDDLRAQTSVNVCVANMVYNTSRTSATRIEVWLPDQDAWYGRILGTGGGGLGGCVDYDDLKWGPSLHFATFGHDGEHDGEHGAVFAQSDEIIVDYATRGLHVAALTSKLLVRAMVQERRQHALTGFKYRTTQQSGIASNWCRHESNVIVLRSHAASSKFSVSGWSSHAWLV